MSENISSTEGKEIPRAPHAALGIAITLLLQHYNVWTPNQLSLAP
jgi:hypothetical protein